MRFSWAAISAAILIAVVALVYGLSATAHTPKHKRKDIAGPGVRIETATGLGSGVYIGNGIIVTAAHVVDGVTGVKIKSGLGDVQDGEVLWRHPEYDIAIVRPAKEKRFTSANLECRTPDVGEDVSAYGNPAGLENVEMRGRVSGEVRKVGHWLETYLVDMTVIGGMSGGPVYDADGDVVGITVGTLGFGRPTGGLGLIVPASTVCGLLGRGSV